MGSLVFLVPDFIRNARALLGVGVACACVQSISAQTKARESESLVDATEQGIEDIELLNRGLPESSNGAAGIGDILPSAPGQPSDLPTTWTNDGETLTDDAQRKAWDAQNWLLAGMRDLNQDPLESEEVENGPRYEQLGENDPMGGSPEFWLELMDGRSEASNPERDGNQNLNQSINPLDEFMSGWLTPEGAQVQALAAELAGGGSPASSPEISWDPMRGSASAESGEGLIANNLLGLGRNSEEASNPYVEAMMGETQSLSVSSSVEGNAAGSLGGFQDASALDATRPTSAPALPSAATEKVREPWRPPAKTDDKYFRNLNRF